MYGNLSKTIVTVPKSFHLSAHITSSTLAENRYKEPTIYDTFSHLRKINSRPNNRYFRLNRDKGNLNKIAKEYRSYADINAFHNDFYLINYVVYPITIKIPFLYFPW